MEMSLAILPWLFVFSPTTCRAPDLPDWATMSSEEACRNMIAVASVWGVRFTPVLVGLRKNGSRVAFQNMYTACQLDMSLVT